MALTLVLAIRGFGVWALVLGQTLGNVVTVAMIWAWAPRRPRLRLRLPRQQLRFLFSFGWPIWLVGIVQLLAANGMLFEIKLALGLSTLGLLRLTISIGERIDTAEHVLMGVLFPVLSRAMSMERLRRAFVLSGHLVLIWAIPTGLGLALFATDIVKLVLGRQWLPIVPLLQVEGVGESINAIGTLWEVFYMATGNTRPSLWVGLQVQLFMLALIGPLGLAFGYPGVAATIGGAVVLSLIQRRRYILRLLPGVPVISSALPLLGAGVAACAAAFGVGLYLAQAPQLVNLSARLAVFLGVYSVIATLLERRLVRDALVLLRSRSQAA
jgi:PST family polysaccharide transporter